MKADPRAVLLGLLWGAGAAATMILLALALPLEGFLALLFPATLLWLLVPFLLLWFWRRLSRGGEG